MEKRVINICDVCEEIFAGGDAPKDRFSETKTDDFSVPIYSNGEANSGLYGYTNFSRVNVPSITVSARGTIGYTTIRHEPFVPIVRLITLVPKTDVIDINYLYYATQNYKFVNNGTSIPQLTVPMLKRYSFPLPSMEQQKKIADEFDKVTVLIDKRKRQLKELDELVKSRFIEMFGDQTANPYGWKKTSIGACCALKSGTSLPADKENEGGAIPYVKVGDMNYPGNEQYITTSSRFVSEQTAGTGVFPVGTVVFPKRGGAIGTNKKRLTRLPICADLNVMGVTAGRRLTPQYLMAYFNTVDLGTLNNGSSVPQINNKDIAPLSICIPPLALQNRFAAFVKQVDKSKFEIKQSLEKLELLKKSLMQKYFG